MSDTVHGEARMKIKDLVDRNQDAQGELKKRGKPLLDLILLRIECVLQLLKPSSRKVKGSVTIRIEQIPSPSVFQERVGEELSQLAGDGRINQLSSTDAHDDDPMGTLRLLLSRMKPFIQALGAASTVRASNYCLSFIEYSDRSIRFSRPHGLLYLH